MLLGVISGYTVIDLIDRSFEQLCPLRSFAAEFEDGLLQ
jgi:hypothetical protein